MRTMRFYCGPAPLNTGRQHLTDDEATHARQVLRLRRGDTITVFDGSGGSATAHIVSTTPRAVEIDVDPVTRVLHDVSRRIEVAVAMPRGPRQDVLIEKCTELGVARITAVHCARSVARPAAGRVARWRRTAVEACKQSGRVWVPQIDGVQDLGDWWHTSSGLPVVVADPDASAGLAAVAEGQDVRVLIGPEGGLTSDERTAAADHGARFGHLGPTILRIETAAVAALARLLLA